MAENEKMVQDVIDFVSDVADETIIAALAEIGLVVTRQATEPTLPADIMTTGFVRLTRIDGVPLSRVKVTVAPIEGVYEITALDGNTYQPNLSVVSVSRYTDGDGYAEFPLVQGSPLRVYTSLSAATREIKVPLDPAPFNLLTQGIEVATDMYSSPSPPKHVLLRSDM